MKKALVIGVGPLNGLGAQLCKKIANNNFEVFHVEILVDFKIKTALKISNNCPNFTQNLFPISP